MKLFRPFPLRPVILALAFAWCGLGAGRAQNVVYELLRDFSSPGLINPRRALTVLNDGTVYGTAQLGGTGSSGGIFKITSGGTYSEPVAFAGVGGTPSGAFPDSELTSDGAGKYWGTTFGGGSASAGTVFRFDPALGTAVTMAELNGLTTGTTRGSSPFYGLTYDGAGTFYGTAKSAGANSSGVIFSVTTAGALTTRVDFTGASGAVPGATPESVLIPDGQGHYLGTCYDKSTANRGTVFRYDPADHSVVRLVDFGSFAGLIHGANPLAGLTAGSDGFFYGCTRYGGASNVGVIYRMAADGTITNVVDLTGVVGAALGSEPIAPLLADGPDAFYGVASKGGSANQGLVFRVTTSGAYTVLFEFTGATGAFPGEQPFAGLTRGMDGNIYGSTFVGGTTNEGTIFRFSFQGGPTLTTNPADNITMTSATLHATVNPGGLATTVNFFINGAPAGSVNVGALIGATPVSKPVTGLTLNTTYTVTTTASNAQGNASGGAVMFTTLGTVPVANDDSYELRVTSVDPRTNDSDPAGLGLTITNVGAAAHGAVSMPIANRVSYVPNASFTGLDSFSYTVRDGNNATSTATITVHDTTPPVITSHPADATFPADAAGHSTLQNYLGQVTATDNSFVVSITQSPPGGTILNVGTTNVIFTATDAAGLTGTATTAITVAAGPVANADIYELPVTSKDPRINDSDPAGLGLTITNVGLAANGTVSTPIANRVSYVPNASFTGTDSFSYTVTDGNNATSTSTVTVQDTTQPVITAHPANATFSADTGGHATLLDYLGQVTATDNSFVKSITQSPPGGTILNVGTTTVTFTATDAAGLTTTAITAITVVAGPVANADSYELPVTSKDPRINDSDSVGLGLTITSVGAAAHGTVSTPIANRVSYVPNATFTGTDSFSYTVTDGNSATATGTITVRDTTPPVITAHPPDATFTADASGHATLADYVAQVTATDNSFVKSIAQSPPAGTLLGIGTTTVTFTATDAAGLTKTATTAVTVGGGLSVVKVTGDPVASVSGATWSAFRSPSIGVGGDVAFAASIAGPGIGKMNGAGVFVAPAAGAPIADTLIARKGDLAPDAASGATFLKFSDPLINSAAHVAFAAKLKGVPPAAASGVFSTDSGGLHGRVLAGSSVAGSTGKVATVLALAQNDADELALLITLTPKLTPAIIFSGGVGAQLVKVAAVGDMLTTTAGARKVKTIAFLPKTKSVYPQTRGLNADGVVLFRANFTDGSSGVFSATISGSAPAITNVALTGGAVPASPAGGIWAGFGQPMLRAGDDSMAFNAALAAPSAAGLFADTAGTPLDRLIAVGDSAPGISGASFAKFSDLLSPAPGVHAFVGSMLVGAGGVSKKTAGSLWAQTATSPLALLARAGFAPPGVPASQKLKKFRAVAQPLDGRAVFAGQLKPGHGVTAKNDVGIWAVDRGGALQLIAREGGTLVVNGTSRKVAALEFLPAVPVVGAATRGFNEDGQLVFRATLKGRVGALFRVNR